jgi:hypothetical protein
VRVSHKRNNDSANSTRNSTKTTTRSEEEAARAWDRMQLWSCRLTERRRRR